MAAARGLYSCNYCDGKFPAQGDIEEHIQRFHQEEVHINLPGSKEDEEPSLDSNARGLFTCNYCNAKFPGKDDIQAHVESFHEDQLELQPITIEPIVDATTTRGLYACNYCDAKFPAEEEIDRHINSVHTDKLGVPTASEDSGLMDTNVIRQRTQHSTTHEQKNTYAHQAPTGQRIYENDPENINNVNDEEDEVDNEYDEMIYHLTTLREAAIPLKLKIRTKRCAGQKLKYWPELSEQAGHQLTGTAWLKSQGENVRSMKSVLGNLSSMFDRFALWNNLLKTVEGTYGGGVYNFFKFLKWSMGLNLLMSVLAVTLITIPEHFNDKEDLECKTFTLLTNSTCWFPKNDSIVCCSEQYRKQQGIKREPLDVSTTNAGEFFGDVGTILLNLMQGDGWMESSYLYYGKYSDDNSGSYQMAVAYFFVMFSCFALSLFAIVRSSALSLKQNFKWNQFNSSQYFDLVFCTWDFSLDSPKSVKIKQLGIVNEMRTAMKTDSIQKNKDDMSTGSKIKLQLKRIFLWFLVMGILGGFGYGLVMLYLHVDKRGVESECPSFDSFNGFLNNRSKIFECYFYQYATTITITAANLFLPFVFSYITQYEEYNPKTMLIVDIIRSIMIRLSGLLVMMFSLLMRNNCSYEEDDNLQACSNQDIEGADCQRKMCWETSVGIEFYKLTVFDIIIQFAVVLLMDIPRTKLPCFKSIPAVSTIEFNIPKHVLDIVYSQTICWMGLFFTPLLSIITTLKLFGIFYLRIWYLRYLCTPSKSLYEASRTSSLLKIFLLVSFTCSFIPLAYIIGQLSPSNSCGPFKGRSPNFYSVVVISLLKEWESQPGKFIVSLFGETPVLMGMSAVLVLLIYYQYMRASAQSAYNDRIEAELNTVAEEKRRLTAELNRAMRGQKMVD